VYVVPLNVIVGCHSCSERLRFHFGQESDYPTEDVTETVSYSIFTVS
jgi:hypothetical protein